jgi:hypothetical protein
MFQLFFHSFFRTFHYQRCPRSITGRRFNIACIKCTPCVLFLSPDICASFTMKGIHHDIHLFTAAHWTPSRCHHFITTSLQVPIDASCTLINIELDGNAFLDIYNVRLKILKPHQWRQHMREDTAQDIKRFCKPSQPTREKERGSQ